MWRDEARIQWCRRMGFISKKLTKLKLKLSPRGKTRLLARQERDKLNGNIDDELARDCKHKEIIKGANEEGNEINTGGAN